MAKPQSLEEEGCYLGYWWFGRCSSVLTEAGTAFIVPTLPNKGLMLFNVFLLVNTCHALEFNAFLMVDALTFFRCHLRAIKIRLNAMFSNCWNINCSVYVLTQIGVFLGLVFKAKQRSIFDHDYMSFALMRGNNPRTHL